MCRKRTPLLARKCFEYVTKYVPGVRHGGLTLPISRGDQGPAAAPFKVFASLTPDT